MIFILVYKIWFPHVSTKALQIWHYITRLNHSLDWRIHCYKPQGCLVSRQDMEGCPPLRQHAMRLSYCWQADFSTHCEHTCQSIIRGGLECPTYVEVSTVLADSQMFAVQTTSACPEVGLQLLGPCEWALGHVASVIPAIDLPGNAHLTFLHTIERLHCMLQLLWCKLPFPHNLIGIQQSDSYPKTCSILCTPAKADELPPCRSTCYKFFDSNMIEAALVFGIAKLANQPCGPR